MTTDALRLLYVCTVCRESTLILGQPQCLAKTGQPGSSGDQSVRYMPLLYVFVNISEIFYHLIWDRISAGTRMRGA